MKMPEGFNRFASTKSSGQPKGVRGQMVYDEYTVGLTISDLMAAAYYLKVMAEELEKFSGTDGYKEVNKIIQRFKDWK